MLRSSRLYYHYYMLPLIWIAQAEPILLDLRSHALVATCIVGTCIEDHQGSPEAGSEPLFPCKPYMITISKL